MGARHVGDIAPPGRVAPPQSRWCSTSARRTWASSARRRRSPRPRARSSRRSRGRGVAVLNADDPLVAAMAARTDGAGARVRGGADADVRYDDVMLDDLGRPSFDLAAGERGARGLGLLGEHHAGNAAAAAARRRWPLGVSRRRGRRRARPRQPPVARAGCRSSSGATASRSSTTPTTPTPTRCAPRSRPWPRSAGPSGRPHRRGPRRDARAGRVEPSRSTTPSAGWPCASTSTSCSSWARGRRPIHLGACLEGSWGGESVFVAGPGRRARWLRRNLGAGDVVLFKASRRQPASAWPRRCWQTDRTHERTGGRPKSR